MTDKIYEYKDEKDWYIGKSASFNYLTCFGGDSVYEELQNIFHQFLANLGIEGVQVHVVKHDSDLRFLYFMSNMLNKEQGRSLKVRPHKGTILITEENQLLFVHFVHKSVSLDTFFGQTTDVSLGDSILIATRNEGKTKEFREMFEGLGIRVENLNDYPDLPEIEETGMTFEENARLKAETVSKLTGKMVLSDDSGLKVDSLGGLPGIWSARFSGPDATDAKNNAKLLHELAMVFNQKDRSAQFHTTLVVAAPNKESLVVEADWPGYIATEPKGENGFGYDPLFLVGETGRHAAELTAEEKNDISHRGLAVKKLMEVFPSWQTRQ